MVDAAAPLFWVLNFQPLQAHPALHVMCIKLHFYWSLLNFLGSMLSSPASTVFDCLVNLFR